MSKPCDECHAVKDCKMYLDRDKRIVYLCKRCARDLNFHAEGYNESLSLI